MIRFRFRLQSQALVSAVLSCNECIANVIHRAGRRLFRRNFGVAAMSNSALKRPIVFVGMMGSGKSAVGSATAKILGVPFVDCDKEIEASVGMSISSIFSEYGETRFREAETRILSRVLKDPPAIIAAGGGTFMNKRNRDEIGKRAISVWLKASPDTLWQRVKNKTTRPLLKTADPYGTLLQLLSEREPIYARATLTARVGREHSVQTTAKRVAEKLIAANADFEIFLKDPFDGT